MNAIKIFQGFDNNLNHTVLYKLDNLNNFIPLNDSFTDKWNTSFVRMPCSPLSFYPVVKDGKKSLSQRWRLINDELKFIPKDVYDIKRIILSYNSRFVNSWNFEALIQLFENELNAKECQQFFNVTYPGMVELALNLPSLVTESIPLLKTGVSHSISMTQLQIASLLSNAFFCTFPRRNSRHSESEFVNYPIINFSSLFAINKSVYNKTKTEKLKCILNYFHRVVTERPDGVVTFTRRNMSDQLLWQSDESDFKSVSVDVRTGSIFSELTDSIKIDFANKFPGGGVLDNGCVQEEILFLTHPELIVSCLFTEKLGDRESLLVQGVQQYSQYTGYDDTFCYREQCPATEPCQIDRDCYGRLRTVISMIDAIRFRGNAQNQFKIEHIERELTKAYCGFSDSMPWSDNLPRIISTGNWGCGVFQGDYQLKCVIQLMVCASVKKDMYYYTFDDVSRGNTIRAMVQLLQDSGCSVGRLWSLLTRYYPDHYGTKDLFEYLRCSLL